MAMGTENVCLRDFIGSFFQSSLILLCPLATSLPWKENLQFSSARDNRGGIFFEGDGSGRSIQKSIGLILQWAESVI